MAVKSCGLSWDNWVEELSLGMGLIIADSTQEHILEGATDAGKKIAKVMPVVFTIIEQVHKAKSMEEYNEKLTAGIEKVKAELKELDIENDTDEYDKVYAILDNLRIYADNHQYIDGEWRNELFVNVATDLIISAALAPIKGISVLFGLIDVAFDFNDKMNSLIEKLNNKAEEHNHPRVSGGFFGDRVNGCNDSDSVDHLYGGSGGDIIIGYAGKDLIYGEEGDDFLFGGEGDDFIYGGSQNDKIFGDQIIGPDDYIYDKSPGKLLNPYRLNKYTFDPETNGNPTNDSGNDLLCGEGGNDIIYGNYGDDTIYGGHKGTEVVLLTTDTATGKLLNYIIADETDYIYGGEGNDFVDGGNKGDFIFGGEGNDTIYGGFRADVIYGDSAKSVDDDGDSDDTIYGGSIVKFKDFHEDGYIIGVGQGMASIDHTYLIIKSDGSLDIDISRTEGSTGEYPHKPKPDINEFKFDKIITIGDYTIIEHDKKQIIVDKANEQITFSDLGVFVNHSAGEAKKANIYHDKIYGGKGRDTISGGIGSDYIDGGEDIARDYISGGDGNDLIYGGSGSDILYGNNGQDIIYGGNHNDYISGGLGSDHLHGGHGEDVIRGYETVNLKSINDAGYLMRLDADTFMVLYKDGTYKLAQTSNYINQNNEISFDQVHTNADGDRVLLTYKDIQVQINTKLSTAIIDDKTGDNFYGGEHDDKLYGGRGDDTYYYNKGDGHDTVSDANGDDRIVFGDGIYSKDITLSQNGDYTNQSVQSI